MSENYNGYLLNDTGDSNWGPIETAALKSIIDKLPAATQTLVGAQHVHSTLVNSSNTHTAVGCSSSSIGLNASVVGVNALSPADLAPTMVFADGADTARVEIVDNGFLGDTFVTGVSNVSSVGTTSYPAADSMFIFANGGMELVADKSFIAISTDGNGGSGDIYIEDFRNQEIAFTSAGIQVIPQGLYTGTPAVTFSTDTFQPLVGFFGVTPVGQQSTPANIGDVIALLQAFGFCV